MYTNRQLFRNPLSAPGTLLTRILWGYVHHNRTGAFSLVAKDAHECRPGDIGDRTGKSVVPEHVGYSEAFHGNRPVATKQVIDHLVVELVSFIAHPGVQLLNSLDGFLAVLPAFFLAGKRSLSASKFGKLNLKKVWIGNVFPITGGEKEFYPHIHAHGRKIVYGGGQFAEIAGSDQMPFSSFFFEGKGFNRSLYRPMQIYPDQTHMLNAEFAPTKPNAVSVGGKFDTVEVVSGFESGISGLFSVFYAAKEVLIRFIQTAHGCLRGREIDAGKVFVCFSFFLKPRGLVRVLDALSFRFKSTLSLRKADVVQAAVGLKHDVEFPLLVPVGPKSVFECFSHSLALLCFNVFANSLFGDISNGGGIVGTGPKGWKPGPKLGKLLAEDRRRIAFEPVDDLGNTQDRLRSDEDVNVVGHNLKGFDHDLQFGGLLQKEFFQSRIHRRLKHLSTVLRTPNEVVLETVNGSGICFVSRFHVRQYTSVGKIIQ